MTGCGYHPTGAPGFPNAMTGKITVIPIFGNKSYRANVGAILTGSLVDEFARRSGGKVTAEESADLVLTGAVMTYSTSPVSFTAADTVKEYRAVMTVEATLSEKASGKVIWKGVLSWGQDYPVNTDVAKQQNAEDAAIREICRNLSQQIYHNISEGF
jgi:outer membrane lipopolysaccharide assembly protein LptE/RlpB